MSLKRTYAEAFGEGKTESEKAMRDMDVHKLVKLSENYQVLMNESFKIFNEDSEKVQFILKLIGEK